MNTHVFIIEDEVKIAQLLADYCASEQYTTTLFHEGSNVVEQVKQIQPDIVLLDLMLPGKDGIQICTEIRRFSNVPIMMITARVEEIDRILGLEIGADDYICKPFSPREVMARVKAVLRRLNSPQPTQMDKDIEIIDAFFSASFKGIRLELTPVEFRLLKTLIQAPAKVFSRDSLMTILYDDNRIVSDRTIDTHIKNLRKKLQSAGCSDERIHSIYGLGYKYERL